MKEKKINIAADEVVKLSLPGGQVGVVLYVLRKFEMTHDTSDPIIRSINAQIRKQKEKKK